MLRQSVYLVLLLSMLGAGCYGLSFLMPFGAMRLAEAAPHSESMLQLTPAERAARIAKTFRN